MTLGLWNSPEITTTHCCLSEAENSEHVGGRAFVEDQTPLPLLVRLPSSVPAGD
jgi:hypothetical protein